MARAIKENNAMAAAKKTIANNDEKTAGWATISDSASGVAHFWEKQKYSRRRSLCGRVTEVKLMQDASQTISECVRCKKAQAAQAA